MDTGSIVAILIALIALVPSVLLYAREKRKNIAEGDSFVVDAAKALVEPLRQRIAELELLVEKQTRQLAEQEKRLVEVEHVAAAACEGAILLTHQLQSHRLQPAWEIPAAVADWKAK
jgi:hypothetical protein